ncbi:MULTISPECIES: DUF3159 domain-containing protein [unclassified Pseudonocardia]|uniref:DUF3159 domain-containing protein n=1 Tax=unclassified Pseudonocardia TaxID=2619320 RepID=UPI0001FFE70C|nr:DUF3159 domain-containing protein [Pseudonocardia sp. Ae707_Ps1]OLM18111.1 putative CONSERVED INTEGRAL MEMBRANE ALANINE AND LEUCINE RICH PROTEIN [Pseudonocardia sp. Ae707_Ps1]
MSDHHDAPTTRLPRIEESPQEQTGPIGAPVPGGAPERAPTLMEQMGGVPGIVASTVPVIVFVVANIVTELRTAVFAAIGAGVLVLLWRLVRRDPVMPAISGLIGVGICALVANQTGEARGFYLPGLLYSGFLGVVALVSIVVRWPLAGAIWHGINGHGTEWRDDPRLVRAYGWATGVWAATFLAKVVVQGGLYLADSETWLGVARLAMGYPLTAVAILATVLIVRRVPRTAT